MNFDYRALEHLTASGPSPSGIAALTRSIHRAPDLREWVTMESVALVPVPVWRGDHWGLISLLTTPTRLETGVWGWHKPWGVIEWSLPDCQVVDKIDLRETDLAQRDQTSHLRPLSLPDREEGLAFSSQPADAQVVLNEKSRTQREDFLFQALEPLLLTTDPSCLPDLAAHYSGLLPAEIYPYYHHLIPDCQSWLHPDVPAIHMPESLASQSEAHPKAMSDPGSQLSGWLRRGKEVADAFSLNQFSTDLQQLEARRMMPGFRLAVVGEFSRGKSSLINRLLDRELLPVCAVPTTATLTSIQPGPEDLMQLNPGQTDAEVRPIDMASWHDLLAIDSTGQERDVLTRVRITINHPWLHDLDVELIDSPGAGDLSEQRALLISDLLSQCDGVIMVVSSTLPFGLSEKNFLEEKVIGQHVPLVLVVLSKLDTIALEQRAEVYQTLQERIARVSANIPILPSHPVDATDSEADVLSALRRQIEAMVARDQRRIWRHRQIAGQLADQMEQMVAIGLEAIKLAEMNALERASALELIDAELAAANLRCEQLKLELEQRGLQRDRQARQNILESRQELLDMLKLDLERTPEPKFWWEKDLPLRVRRELVRLSHKSEDFVLKAFAHDLEWLDNQAKKSFQLNLHRGDQPASEKFDIQPDYRDVELTDSRRYRVLTRLGCSGGVLCGYLFGGPIGVVASTGIWFLGEQIITKQLDSQRQMLAIELDRCLGRAFDAYCTAVSARFRSLYQQLAHDLNQEQATWCTTRRQTLQTSLGRPQSPPWQQLVDQGRALQQEILSVL
jgi:GTPase SAR1 family protein